MTKGNYDKNDLQYGASVTESFAYPSNAAAEGGGVSACRCRMALGRQSRSTRWRWVHCTTYGMHEVETDGFRLPVSRVVYHTGLRTQHRAAQCADQRPGCSPSGQCANLVDRTLRAK